MSALARFLALAPFALGCAFSQSSPLTFLALQSMVSEARVREKKTLQLLPRTLHLDTETVGISNLDGFTLEGISNRTALIGHTLRPLIIFERCANLTLRNLRLDYDPLPFTQAEITAVEARGFHIEYRVLPGYPELDPAYLSTTALFFDRETRAWKDGFPEAYYLTNLAFAPDVGRLAVLRSRWDAVAAPRVGDYLVLVARKAPALLFIDCTNVILEHVVIEAAPSAGLLFRRLEGTNSISKLVIRRGLRQDPRFEERLLSTGATGVVVGASRGLLRINGLQLSFTGEGGLHTHGELYPVDRGEGWVFQVLDPHEELANRLVTSRFPLSARGWDPITWVSRGSAPLIAVVTDEPRQGARPARVRLVLDRLMEQRLRAGDLVEFPELNGGLLEVTRSHFRELRGSALRIGNAEVRVSHCAFDRLRAGALVAPAAYDRGEPGWTARGEFVSNVLIGRELPGGIPHPLEVPFLSFRAPPGAERSLHGPWRIEDNLVSPDQAVLFTAPVGFNQAQ